jgi:hypothetical protein
MTPTDLTPSPFISSPRNAPTTNNGRLFAILHFLKDKSNREPLCEFVKNDLHALQTAETLFLIKENIAKQKELLCFVAQNSTQTLLYEAIHDLRQK